LSKVIISIHRITVVKIQHLHKILAKLTKNQLLANKNDKYSLFIINNNNLIKGVINMNKLKKIGLSALAGSLVAVSANAGEMAVTGSAWIGFGQTTDTAATFNSMTDSLTFTGTGELDNGMTVTLVYEIDGDASSDANAAGAGTTGNFDTHYVKLDTDFGSITYSGHGVDSNLSANDDKTPNAYEEAWDAGTADADNTLVGTSLNDSFKYDSPSFNGLQASFYYAGQDDGTNVVGAYTDIGITFKPEMVEGLTIGYAEGEKDESSTLTLDQDTMYVTYAYGPVTVGYQKSESTTSTSDVTYNKAFESTAYSATFAVNENLSIGYGEFEADYESTSLSDQESSAFTASYTMGSMTIGGLIGSDDNVKGVDSVDNDKWEASISFAF